MIRPPLDQGGGRIGEPARRPSEAQVRHPEGINRIGYETAPTAIGAGDRIGAASTGQDADRVNGPGRGSRQRARTRAAVFVVSTARETSVIEAAMSVTFREMARTASAASCMLDDISRVTTLCSSTAADVLTT